MSTTTAAKPLTARQQEVFEWIRWHIEEMGYSPSLRELSDHFRFNLHAAAQHRDVLVKKGYLTFNRGQARGMAIRGGAA